VNSIESAGEGSSQARQTASPTATPEKPENSHTTLARRHQATQKLQFQISTSKNYAPEQI
jgi:hypothetical protein